MVALVIFVLFTGFVMVLRGVSLDVFWDWFIAGPDAPWANSAPDLSFAQALGLSLVVGFLVYQTQDTDTGDKDATTVVAESIGKSIFIYAVFWIFAILYHSWM